MIKSIIKEIIIILLLLVAVVLALGVFFYDYIPTNKVIPTVEPYMTSQMIKTELQESVTENEILLETYRITADDLKQYERTKDYDKGKVNPFSTYEEETPNAEEQNGTSVNSLNTNTNTQKGNTSTGNTFYNQTGTK